MFYVCCMLQVRTIIRNSFKEALDQYDILISPAAPSVAYKIGKHLHIFPFALLHVSASSSNCFIVFDICR
jgi:Asp-tRNA(Asn)/Glu-tRNA(Gln) amidotransferase A subunit family amidase